MNPLVFLLCIIGIVVATSCRDHDRKTLWIVNDTGGVVEIHPAGTGPRLHTLQPGEVLDVLTEANPGLDEFEGEIDGVPFEFTINTGEIGQYEYPDKRGHYRIPLSRFIITE